jgi:hypothetical protein
MSEERWASRDEFTEVEFVYVFNGQPREHHGDFVWKGEKCTVVCKVRASEWHANPSNPRIEPGECIELDPSSFVVTARAKPEERWWLIEDHGKDPYVFRSRSSLSPIPSPQTFSQSEAIGLGLFQLYDIVPSLGRPFVRDITHKVKAARAAGGTE